MRNASIIMLFVVVVNAACAVVNAVCGRWWEALNSLTYTIMSMVFLAALALIARKNEIISRLTEHIDKLMRRQKRDHENGEKVIKWYIGENARLAEENKRLKEQLVRLTSIHHIHINEENYNYE